MGIGLIGSVVIVRNLSVTAYGYLAAATAVIALASALGLFGLDQLFLSGRLREADLRRMIWRIAAVGSMLGVLASATWPGLNLDERLLVLILSGGAGLESLRILWLLSPQKHGLYVVRARRELLAKIAVVGVSCVAAFAFQSAPAVALAGVSANLLVTTVGILSIRRDLPKDPKSPPLLIFGWLRKGMPFAMSGGLYTVYFAVDLALLGSLATAEHAAYYRVAFAFIAVATAIPIAMNNEVFRPRMYHLVNDPDIKWTDIEHLTRQFLRLNLAMGVTVAVGMATAGAALLPVIFGDRYEPAAPLLIALSFGVAFHYYNSWAGNLLVSIGSVGTVVSLQAVSAVGNITANVVLIPMRGASGAAWATVGTEVALCVCYSVVLARVRSTRKLGVQK